MRIALVSDLHGNMTAVKVLEKDLYSRQADAIWCLGDVVGKGPNSHLTFDWAVRNCAFILRGNWDEGIGLRQFKRDGFYYEQLGEARMAALVNFPLEKHVTFSGRRIRLIHGRPVMDRLYYIQDPRDTLLSFLEPDFDMMIYGDCHRQGLRTISGQIANVGSVGNAMGIPMVQYAILEGEMGEKPAPMTLSYITIPYDNEAAVAETLAQAELPDPDAFVSELKTGVYARQKGSLSNRRNV